MKENTLKVQMRNNTGKGFARRLRAGGLIPGIIYGEGIDPIPLTISAHEVSRLISKSTSKHFLVDLDFESAGQPKKALIKEIQTDPVTSRITCVDFQQISMDKKIHVSAPVTLTGIPDGVKNMGGILEFLCREIEISCLPADIPEKIELDVTNLKIGEVIHAGDISLPNVIVLTHADVSLATVVAPTIIKGAEAGPEEAAAAEEVPAEGEQKEPEVISQKKEEKEE